MKNNYFAHKYDSVDEITRILIIMITSLFITEIS
jgi:hypothetical protein